MKKTHYVKHTSCPKCNSRDNLALYSDGSGYCFGCGFVLKSKVSGYVYNAEASELQGLHKRPRWLACEQVPIFNKDVVEWISSAGLDLSELISRGASSVEGRANSIVFQWFDAEGSPILQQVRYFPSDSKRKYTTYGTPNDVLPIYYAAKQSRKDASEEGTATTPRADQQTLRASDGTVPDQPQSEEARLLVIVEDALSAIKIARRADAMPCLGSDLPLVKLTRLARLYDRFVVWLDGDMYGKAQKMAKRLSFLGAEARVVWTEQDPKYHSDEEIVDKLQQTW